MYLALWEAANCLFSSASLWARTFCRFFSCDSSISPALASTTRRLSHSSASTLSCSTSTWVCVGCVCVCVCLCVCVCVGCVCAWGVCGVCVCVCVCVRVCGCGWGEMWRKNDQWFCVKLFHTESIIKRLHRIKSSWTVACSVHTFVQYIQDMAHAL